MISIPPHFILPVILLAIELTALAVALLYGLRPYRKAAGFANPSLPGPGDALPKASVIIISQGNEEDLGNVLESIGNQDYPDFETIVVCDSNAEQTAILRERHKNACPNLHFTFVQPGSHNLSRRKLALTLGLKAATGEIAVITASNASIPSSSWLLRMIAPFAGEQGHRIDVVLGVSKMNFNEMQGPGKWYRMFDTMIADALWTGYAAMGRPYRGDGYNLAFRRSVFFAHKGYAGTINLHSGDDDLFVNEISTGANTRVAVGPDTVVTMNWGGASRRVWSIRKARYAFTARWLPKAPFANKIIFQLTQWITVGCAAAATALSWPLLWCAIPALLAPFALWGCEIAVCRKLAARTGRPRLWWAVPPFWLWRPVANAIFRFNHRGTKKKNYTWQR